ncbi:hypothetical protein PTKIN_Ptkin15bG0090000 [Pterospermum kingtungense]
MVAVRSTEEMDQIERSTKKSKITNDDFDSVDVMMETIPSNNLDATKEMMGLGASIARPSFKDTLLRDRGRGSTSALWDDEGLVSDDDEEVNIKEEEEECPTIRLTKEEKIRLRQLWCQTLIGKVLRRSVGYNTLLRRIMALWRPKLKIEMVAIENDYFLIKFKSSGDYHYTKFEGPWMVMEHYLIVPVRVDQATSLVSRGKFARLCVEDDITKPLLSKLKLKRRVRRIEYEGIHQVCFHCGIYGHHINSCSRKINCDNDVNRGEIPKPNNEVEINLEITESF